MNNTMNFWTYEQQCTFEQQRHKASDKVMEICQVCDEHKH